MMKIESDMEDGQVCNITSFDEGASQFSYKILLVPRLIDRSISRRRKEPFGKLLKFLSAISRASPADGIKGRWGGRARIKRGVVRYIRGEKLVLSKVRRGKVVSFRPLSSALVQES